MNDIDKIKKYDNQVNMKYRVKGSYGAPSLSAVGKTIVAVCF